MSLEPPGFWPRHVDASRPSGCIAYMGAEKRLETACSCTENRWVTSQKNGVMCPAFVLRISTYRGQVGTLACPNVLLKESFP